jgi:hypothetical protein
MNDSNLVKSIARGMIERLGNGAVSFVSEQAEIAEALSDPISAATWRDIADEIEQLSRKP